MENSKIEWTHHTFNPWEGCAKVSQGCKNCYADARHDRYHGDLGKLACWGIHAPRMARAENYWREPLRWNAEARKAGERRHVFCASLADVFEAQSAESKAFAGKTLVIDKGQPSRWLEEGEAVPKGSPTRKVYTFVDIDEMRKRLWQLIEETPWLDWLLLTKRPENVAGMVPAGWTVSDGHYWPANVWLGTSVENQEAAELRIPYLCGINARIPVRFLSMEPLLGKVWLMNIHMIKRIGNVGLNALNGTLYNFDRGQQLQHGLHPVNWVIVGGESGGSQSRHLHPEFVRQVRDNCAYHNVAFFFKQWGDHLPVGFDTDGGLHSAFDRVGKERAGRLLDGRLHDEFPTSTR